MSDPLYYNSLVDKHTKRHLTRPSVKIHFEKCGFIAKDGTVYPTRREQIEANRANRLLEEKEAILLKVEERERARMERLRKMARAGDVVFTKEGIVEAKPCSLCHSYHKIASLLSPPEPCPGSQLAKYATLDPLPATYRSKTSRKHKRGAPMGGHVSTQTSHVQPAHMSTQTSYMEPVQMSTQTSHVQPAHMSTQTSQVASGHWMSTQTSFVQPSTTVQEEVMGSSTAAPDMMSNSALFSSDLSSKGSVLSYEPSVSGTYSPSLQDTSDMIDSLKQDAENLKRKLQEDMLNQEEDALRERLQYELKLQRKSEKKLKMVEVEIAKRELSEKRQLEATKLELHRELKRKIALETMLNTLNAEQQRMEMMVEKERLDRELAEEKYQLQKLIEEQVRLHVQVE